MASFLERKERQIWEFMTTGITFNPLHLTSSVSRHENKRRESFLLQVSIFSFFLSAGNRKKKTFFSSRWSSGAMCPFWRPSSSPCCT